jgi:hypothetical protein
LFSVTADAQNSVRAFNFILVVVACVQTPLLTLCSAPGQIHALEPPGLSKRQLFANPANGDFDGIVYFLLVNVSSVGGCRGSDAFSNALTGCVNENTHYCLHTTSAHARATVQRRPLTR